MRLLASFIVLITFSSIAEINSSQQIFFGENTPTIKSCGPNGQMLKVSDIENIGQDNLCNDVRSRWGQWKVLADDGSFWTLFGYGHNCDLKMGADPNNQSLCITHDNVSNNNAYLFESTDFKGNYPWGGHPIVNIIGDEAVETKINSFKLGNNVQLIAYADSNFKGIPKIFLESSNDPKFEIRSYKIKPKTSLNNVTFNFLSHSQYRTCLKLKASLSVRGLINFCSEDTGGNSKILAEISDQKIVDTISVYIEEYVKPYVTTTHSGVIYLDYDGQGSFSLDHEVLPKQLSVIQDGNNLSFFYK